MKIPNLSQLQICLSTVFSALSTLINSNSTEMKNYVRSIQETTEGVKFLDGNGNVLYELKIVGSGNNA